MISKGAATIAKRSPGITKWGPMTAKGVPRIANGAPGIAKRSPSNTKWRPMTTKGSAMAAKQGRRLPKWGQ